MSRRKSNGVMAGLVAMAVVGAMPLAATAADGELRVTRSEFYASDGRSQRVPDRISRDEVMLDDAGTLAVKSRQRGASAKGSTVASSPLNTEFWFYDVDVELFADQDLDGYHYGIDLLFDADTIYERADVFAVLYLSREGGDWFEYAETDVFPLFGATSDDDFVVVSELLTGYPSGSYDILIELYDTWDGALVAEIGPADSSELGYLRLEDADRDEPYVPPPDVVVVDGGGALDWRLLLALAVIALARMTSAELMRRRRVPALLAARRRRVPSRAPHA